MPSRGTLTHYYKAVTSSISSLSSQTLLHRSGRGYYGKVVQIKVTTVAKALSAITTSIHLVVNPCHFKTTEDDYILPIKPLIEGLRRNNPPPIPQLALSIRVPNDCCIRGLLSKPTYIQATGGLITIAFYYLLRYGEYTSPCYVQRRDGTLMQSMWTKHFTVGDVGFCKGGCQLPRNSPLHLLLQADSATLQIKNHKNGSMWQHIHHKSFASNICTCKALERQILHILTNGGST